MISDRRNGPNDADHPEAAGPKRTLPKCAHCGDDLYPSDAQCGGCGEDRKEQSAAKGGA